MMPWLCLLLLTPADERPGGVSTFPTEEVRKVVAVVVAAAEEDATRGQDRRRGNALADFYVRRAAAAAVRDGLSAKAFLLGLAVGLDHTDLVRNNLLLRAPLAAVESDADRRRRLRVLGEPSLRGRRDWLLHFAGSAAVTAWFGAEAAEQAGLAKELLDSRGDSGFSFTDLAADYAGVALARKLLQKDDAGRLRLGDLAEHFRGEDFLPRLDDLEDSLPARRFVEKYGGPRDPRFLKACEALRKRVADVPGLKGDR